MYRIYCYGSFGRQEFGVDYPTLAKARAAKACYARQFPYLRYIIRKINERE